MSRLGNKLIHSMAEALAHARSEKTGAHVHKIVPTKVRSARESLGLSQDKFANALGISASALRKWEQGQRNPTVAARIQSRVAGAGWCALTPERL